MKFFQRVVLTAFSVILLPTAAWAAVYQVDSDHSSVSFKIRHLLSNVEGTFRQYEGMIEYEPGKPETWKTQGTVQAASIDTRVAERDKHLRSADFFETDKYPTISFRSTKAEASGENKARVEGLLTLHGVEKPVTLDVDIHGIAKDPWGNVRAAFTAVTKINRKDFGLEWNQTLETGQLLVGEEVSITLELEGILQQ